MSSPRRILISLCVLLWTCSISQVIAAQPLKAVATTPEIAEILTFIGGANIGVESLLTGTEDPHSLEATPRLLELLSGADLLCVNGLGLEKHWLEPAIKRARNTKILQGAPGYCDLGRKVTALTETPWPVGSHTNGNPHYSLSPPALAQAALEIQESLSRLVPEQNEYFKKRLALFQTRMSALHKRLALLLPSDGKTSLIEYHSEFGYFLAAYGLKSAGSIEESPGVTPSPIQIAKILERAKKGQVTCAIGSLHVPISFGKRFEELTHLTFVRVPTGVTLGSKEFGTIEQLQNYIVTKTAQALTQAAR